MFIGHYGPAFAGRAIEKRLPLWLLFIAVQWLDVMWSALVMLNVEKLRIVKGFTESSSLDLYYMPFTHGLVGALALSAVLGAITTLYYKERRVAIWTVVGGAVFSHWILDLVVHVPDLPLWADSYKVGFGLWRHVWLSLPLELLLMAGGALLYARALPSRSCWALLALFVAIMGAIEIYGVVGPDPTSPVAEAQTALIAYAALAAVAGLVDYVRGGTLTPVN
jgi:hypothetical protein